jgi:hypothetical protein
VTKEKPKRPPVLTFMMLATVFMMGAGWFARPHEYATGAKDTVTWAQLSKSKLGAGAALYPKDVEALDGREIDITGYMFPLEGAENQKHFLLSAYPPTCPFCLPGGPSEMIDVKGAKGDIPLTYTRLALHGRLHLLKTAQELQDGMLYELTAAEVR